MNHVAVNEDQVPFAGQKRAVVEKELPVAVHDVKNLVFIVKMADAHVVFAAAVHMLQRDAVHRGAIRNKAGFFHGVSFLSRAGAPGCTGAALSVKQLFLQLL